VKTRLAEDRIDYTGRELRPNWLSDRLGLPGDAIAAFIGSCDVSGKDLVDLEDFELGNVVAGEEMLHFIVEIFGMDLPGIVYAQRLLCTIVRDLVNEAVGRPVVTRHGDDLFIGDGKLSVSVATASPVSGLIHLGLNITVDGVPVKAAALSQVGLDPVPLAGAVLAAFAGEIDSCHEAAGKVRPVH
jgi:hypothetical protein